jgi:hypothetical protein
MFYPHLARYINEVSSIRDAAEDELRVVCLAYDKPDFHLGSRILEYGGTTAIATATLLFPERKTLRAAVFVTISAVV